MHRADIIVLTPPAWIDASFAIAACRSGAKGYLDIEYATEQQAWEQLRRLELHAPGPFGIKVGGVLDRDIVDMHAIPRSEFMRLAWADRAKGAVPRADHPVH